MTVALIDGDIIAYRAAVLGVDDFDGEEFFDPGQCRTDSHAYCDRLDTESESRNTDYLFVRRNPSLLPTRHLSRLQRQSERS